MPESLGESVLTLRTDNSQLRSGIAEGQSLVDSWRSKVGLLHDAVELVGKAWEGVATVTETLKGWIESAGASEMAVKRLESALKATGDAADIESLKTLASDIQSVTKYSDEQVMESERLLLSFGAEAAQIDRLTRASVALASGLGLDLGSATMLLAKATEGNTAALARYGIRVDETADKGTQLEQVLRQIESRFGNIAEDEGKTFLGLWERVKNSFDEVREALGRVIINSPALQALLEGIQQEFLGLAQWVDASSASITEWVDVAIRYALEAVQQLVQWIRQLAVQFNFTSQLGWIDSLSAALDRLSGRANSTAQTMIEKFQNVDGSWSYVTRKIESTPLIPHADTTQAMTALQQFADLLVKTLADAGLRAGKAMMQQLGSTVVTGWENIGSWIAAASSPQFYIDLMMQGSPKLPYSDYLGKYAPAVMQNFVNEADQGIMTLKSNFTDTVTAMRDVFAIEGPKSGQAPGFFNVAGLKTWEEKFAKAPLSTWTWGVGGPAGGTMAGATPLSGYQPDFYNKYLERTALATEKLAASWSQPGTAGRVSAATYGANSIASGSRGSYY